MWVNLPIVQRDEYKKIILAFASLTEMFAQKSEDDSHSTPSPIINSKFQETTFGRVFNATIEDIGNTAYDATLSIKDNSGKVTKYLIGIKTFGIKSGDQKIAQFKANHDDWSELINSIKENSMDINGNRLPKATINKANEELYYELAIKIASLRNLRIDSAEENLRGFTISKNDNVSAVYHVLMPSEKNSRSPAIYVGETSYDRIDIDNLSVIGCTKADNPTNFEFTDNKHVYKYTSADSQLLMKFNNQEIALEKWNVIYADDAYSIFQEIGNKIYSKKQIEFESYSWKIEVHPYSGFNSFYGTGSKQGEKAQKTKLKNILQKYQNTVEPYLLEALNASLTNYFSFKPVNDSEHLKKEKLRTALMEQLQFIKNEELQKDVLSMLFRPREEVYIPIPHSNKFHHDHPDFFGKGIGKLDGKKAVLPKEQRKFTLVFEPSGDEITAFVTQDFLKGIQSYEKQSTLGEWLLRKVFQLDEYEQLTQKHLNNLGINGIRLAKDAETGKIHLSFIWIDSKKIPKDYVG